MKYLIIVVLYLFCYSSTAQQVSIITESDSVQVKIQGMGSLAFLTTTGYFGYSEILRVVFHETPKEAIVSRLKENNIPYAYQALDSDVIYAIKAEPQIRAVDNVELSLGKFNKTRKSGKALQLLGTLVSAVGLAIGEYEIAAGGSGLSLIGFAIDMTAGEHLKKYEN
jgi:hypothetical protein